MGKIVEYLKDRNGKTYKVEYIYGGLIQQDRYCILSSSNEILTESTSKERAIRQLEHKVGPVRKD